MHATRQATVPANVRAPSPCRIRGAFPHRRWEHTHIDYPTPICPAGRSDGDLRHGPGITGQSRPVRHDRQAVARIDLFPSSRPTDRRRPLAATATGR